MCCFIVVVLCGDVVWRCWSGVVLGCCMEVVVGCCVSAPL